MWCPAGEHLRQASLTGLGKAISHHECQKEPGRTIATHNDNDKPQMRNCLNLTQMTSQTAGSKYHPCWRNTSHTRHAAKQGKETATPRQARSRCGPREGVDGRPPPEGGHTSCRDGLQRQPAGPAPPPTNPKSDTSVRAHRSLTQPGTLVLQLIF